jgi:hypothetical protein
MKKVEFSLQKENDLFFVGLCNKFFSFFKDFMESKLNFINLQAVLKKNQNLQVLNNKNIMMSISNLGAILNFHA